MPIYLHCRSRVLSAALPYTCGRAARRPFFCVEYLVYLLTSWLSLLRGTSPAPGTRFSGIGGWRLPGTYVRNEEGCSKGGRI